MVENNSIQRRKLLKLIPVTVISSSFFVGTGNAAKGNGIDRDFDPDKVEQVKKVTDILRTLSEERRNKIFNSFTKEQQQAVLEDFLVGQTLYSSSKESKSSDSNLGTTSGHDHVDDGGGGGNDGGGSFISTSYTATVSAYSSLGSHLWDWHHKIMWEYDGSHVQNVDYYDYADIHDSTWSYDGTTQQNLSVYDFYFNAFRQAKLTFTFGGTYDSASPYSELEGYGDGDASTIQKNNGL